MLFRSSVGERPSLGTTRDQQGGKKVVEVATPSKRMHEALRAADGVPLGVRRTLVVTVLASIAASAAVFLVC